MLNLKLVLDGKIASVNSIYKRGKYGGVYLAPEVVQYRKEVAPVIDEAYSMLPKKDRYAGGLLVVKAEIWADFFTKGGDVRRVDVDNFAKQILDAIFPVLDIDDKMVFDLRLRKKQYKGNPKAVVHIKEFENGNQSDSSHKA